MTIIVALSCLLFKYFEEDIEETKLVYYIKQNKKHVQDCRLNFPSFYINFEFRSSSPKCWNKYVYPRFNPSSYLF